MSANPKGPSASLKVAVIGSGLSAVGAIKALTELGVKATVLDSGELLEEDRAREVDRLAALSPKDWKPEERSWLNKNYTVKAGGAIPKKLVFGSAYFYGGSKLEAPLESVGNPPPFSYALGGLSSGWGAAVLPAQPCDISDWPLGSEELEGYCQKVLEGLPYSAVEDGLSLNFPILAGSPKALRLSPASRGLLDSFEKSSLLKKDETLFGQSRLMIAPGDSPGQVGCKYCGQCMSGCVYHSIYKAGDDIRGRWKRGEIDYEPGCVVDRLEEAGGKVTVHYFDKQGVLQKKEFDRVFLAAGAVNSARIVMNSLKLFKEKAVLRTRGGFVVPVLSFRRLPIAWPDCNTEPGLFLGFRGKGLEHWIHVQISTENELLLQMLGAQAPVRGLLGRLKKFIREHLLVLLVNYHSDHSGVYELQASPSNDPEKAASLHTVHRKSYPQWGVLWRSGLRLLSIFARVGCLPLLPLAKLNSGSYHVGGTLPMKTNPAGPLDTDTLGRVKPWQKIHVVDTAVFPSLPGTTIGLLTMANAYRIVEKTEWQEKPSGKS